MTNIIDVDIIDNPHGGQINDLYGKWITELVDGDVVRETFSKESETTEDIQKQNMADFAKFFDSLNRDKKRKIMRNRIRCKRLHPRVGTKKWVRQQITNRLSQCK